MKLPDAEYCLFWINHWSTCSTKAEWTGIVQSSTVVAVVAAYLFKRWIKNNAWNSIGNCVRDLLKISAMDGFESKSVTAQRTAIAHFSHAKLCADSIEFLLQKHDFGAHSTIVLRRLVDTVRQYVPDDAESRQLFTSEKQDGTSPIWEVRKAARNAAFLFPRKFKLVPI